MYLTFVFDLPCVMCIPQFLIYRQVLTPMLYCTGGTIVATQLAYECGWAINLGGGYHHASSDSGGGFCVYGDIQIAIRILQNKHKLKTDKKLKVMIVDLDAHQGNGYQRDFMGEKDNVFIFDMYQSPNMDDPEAKKAISAGFPLAVHTADDTYLKILRAKLPECIDKFEPELIFYNAGTDCLIGDPMGGLSISRRGIIARDEIVFGHAIGREIPIVMVLSGGYQSNNARVIADSILHLSRKFGLFGKELKKNQI